MMTKEVKRNEKMDRIFAFMARGVCACLVIAIFAVLQMLMIVGLI